MYFWMPIQQARWLICRHLMSGSDKQGKHLCLFYLAHRQQKIRKLWSQKINVNFSLRLVLTTYNSNCLVDCVADQRSCHGDNDDVYREWQKEPDMWRSSECRVYWRNTVSKGPMMMRWCQWCKETRSVLDKWRSVNWPDCFWHGDMMKAPSYRH